ncbi:MAG: helix-turn-helix transcriptional regulator [Raoultibacter sp.]
MHCEQESSKLNTALNLIRAYAAKKGRCVQSVAKRNKKVHSAARPKNRLCYFGIVAPFVWFHWINTCNVQLAWEYPWQITYLALALSLITIVFIQLVFRRWAGKDYAERLCRLPLSALDWGCAAAMACACPLVAFAPFSPFGEGIAVLATIMGGMALGWAYVRWGMFYAKTDTRHMILFLFTASLCWPLMEVVLNMAALTLSCFFAAAMPLLGVGALHRSYNNPPKTSTVIRHFQPDNLIAMWKVWVVIIALSLVTSVFIASAVMFSTLDGTIFNLAKSCLTAILCAGILVWALKTNLPFDFPLSWRLVMFALGGGLVLIAVEPSMVLAGVFFRVAPGILIPMTWITVCDIARHSDTHRCTIVGLGLCAYSLPSFLGVIVYDSLAGIVDVQVMGTLLLFLLFIVLGLCLETRDPDIRHIFEDLREPLRLPSDFETINDRCCYIGQQHALTSREIEVMQMVCKGRSRTFIAETLFISENTVKSHVSRIYTKLNIHRKEELQKLIGS